MYGLLIYSIIIILSLLTFDKIVFMIFGANYLNSKIIFEIMLPIPLTVFINNIYGIQFLINLGHADKYSRVFFISGIFNLIFCSILTYFFSYNGTAISWFLSELSKLLGMYFYAVKYVPAMKIKYFICKKD